MTSTAIALALTALYLADVLWHRQCQTRRPRRVAKALVILIAYPVAGLSVDVGLLVLIGSFVAGHLYRPGPGLGERWDTRRTHRRAASLDQQPLRSDRPGVDDAQAAAKTRALQAAARIAEAKSAEAEARARRAAALARAAEIKAATARAEADERARVGKEIDEAYASQAAEGSDAATATDPSDF
jgi:hypothetical protein